MGDELSNLATREIKRFYVSVLQDLLQRGLVDRAMRILVVCGGKLDHEVFTELGFKDVVISNLDRRASEKEYAPLGWSCQDVENLTFMDNEIDFCVVHDGLHHCRSPHRGLLEMYRVAKKGVLVYEPRDSLATRLAVRLNFGETYETASVFHNGCEAGGVQNTEIPNFIYRWTEREARKTVTCFAPWAPHKFLFWYGMRIHWGRFKTLKNKLLLVLAMVAFPMVKLVAWLFPKQANNFAFAVIKPDLPRELYPWLKLENGKVRVERTWLTERYHK